MSIHTYINDDIDCRKGLTRVDRKELMERQRKVKNLMDRQINGVSIMKSMSMNEIGIACEPKLP